MAWSGRKLRLLWLDEGCRHNRYDDWLHWRFAKKISDFSDIFFYSPFAHEKEPNFTPIRYSREKKLADIIAELKIDCVIQDTKAGAYHNYLPDILYHDKHGGHTLWLPPDFKDVKVLKVCIEEDFQYETNYNWHEEFGFTLVLQKHYVNSRRPIPPGSIEVKYFPFSVDTSVFIDRKQPRAAKIGFAGTRNCGNALSGGSVYRYRELAVDTIRSAGYLADKSTGPGERIEGQEYVNYLQRYAGYVSCGSVYNLTPAKMFEIQASGGILFTNKTLGLDKILTDNTYETYNETCSDLIEKVKNVCENVPYREAMASRAWDCIRLNHTHEIRIKELLGYIEERL